MSDKNKDTSTRAAVAARQAGDRYQAFVFWLKAIELLNPQSTVQQVGIEFPESEHFDDVVLYHRSHPDDTGTPVDIDGIQTKFKVMAKSIGLAYLISPKAIYSKTTSLLQRVLFAYNQCQSKGQGGRFWLICPMPLSDELAEFHDSETCRLDPDRMLKSAKGKALLETMRDHLGLPALDEVVSVLRTFRIQPGYSTRHIREVLEPHLELRGLKSVAADDAIEPYSQLAQLIIGKFRSSVFTQPDLEDLLEQYGLYAPKQREYCHTAVLSREWGIRHVEELCECSPLDLRSSFVGRHLAPGVTWDGEVAPAVRSWVAGLETSDRSYALHLECQFSLALLAGFYLNANGGVRAVPVQKSPDGTSVWDASGLSPSGPGLAARPLTLGNGTDTAFVLSLTHNVDTEAEAYIRSALSQVSEILFAQVEGGASLSAVKNAGHAQALAEQAVVLARELKTKGKRVHLFVAVPNSVAFYLGQRIRPVGPLTAYEYDLDHPDQPTYFAGVTLPPLSGMLPDGGQGYGAD